VKRDHDPVVFKGITVTNPKRSEQMTVGDWHLAGDPVEEDEESYYEYVKWGADNIITSGYRVDPVEAEDAIIEQHPVQQVDVLSLPGRPARRDKGFVKLVSVCRTSGRFAGRYRSWFGQSREV